MKYITLFILVFLPLTGFAEAPAFSKGSGKFRVEGGEGHASRDIEVYYHLPKSYSQSTKVLFVIPGAGRNGWSYRGSWIEASEKYNVLILSPSYSEEHYPKFWNYNLARMISNVKINASKTAIESYTVVHDSEEWIFDDFDRIFDIAIAKLSLEAEKYDMFGHSAGGQILHRYAMFDMGNKADRMLSSNSGWYTVPTFEQPFPYGLKTGVASKDQIKRTLSKKLVLFLGELDNDDETRGHLARSEELDVQGTNRLDRGKYFYQKSHDFADEVKADLNWKIHVVEGIGHDYRGMGKAAASYLYEDSTNDSKIHPNADVSAE